MGPSGINGTNSGSTSTANKFGATNTAMLFLNPSLTSTTVVQWATHPVNSNVNFSGTQDFTYSFLVFCNSPFVHTAGFYDNNLNYGGTGIWFWNASGFPQIQFNYKNASVGTTNGAFPVGIWHAVACVRAAGILKVYIDGLLNATTPEGTNVPAYTYPARFGTMFFASYPHYNGFNGKLDEFRIYNRALSDAEIAGLAITTLPLKLGDFTAVKEQSGIKLNWETLSEQNTSYFEIERSNDGTNFTAIGRLNARGNSTDKQYYSYIDNQPATGTNFYRLKLADIDGAFTYSRIIAVKNDNNLITLQLFPNPVTDILQVQIPATKKETVTILITDAAGKTVYSKKQQLSEGNNAASIPVQHLPEGTYLLIINGKAGRQTKLFIKQ